MMMIIIIVMTISKSFRKYLIDIPVEHVVTELQKATILGTTHISESAKCRSTEHSAWEIALYAIYIVATELLQHCTP